MPLRRITGWSVLAFLHRWLGIAGCLLFMLWFVSGIAMMYVRMPELTTHDRLERSRPIDTAAVRVSLADARAAAQATGAPVQLTMLRTPPVYRFSGRRPVTIFADHLEIFAGLSPSQAMALARDFAPE